MFTGKAPIDSSETGQQGWEWLQEQAGPWNSGEPWGWVTPGGGGSSHWQCGASQAAGHVCGQKDSVQGTQPGPARA